MAAGNGGRGASEAANTVVLDGVELRESPAVDWLGNEDLVGQEEARTICRLALGLDGAGHCALDPPFYPVLVGPPGVGKTTLAFQLAREASRGRGVFAVQCHQDVSPEDLCVTPVLGEDGRVRYQMSGLATAAHRGAAAVLDEASRLQPSAWAAILGALDARRSLTSVVAGVRIPVREGFSLILTMNRGEETYELPPAVRSRLGPFVPMKPIRRDRQIRMLKTILPGIPEEEIRKGLEFLSAEIPRGVEISPRSLVMTFRMYGLLLGAAGGRPSRRAMRRALSLIVERSARTPGGEGLKASREEPAPAA